MAALLQAWLVTLLQRAALGFVGVAFSLARGAAQAEVPLATCLLQWGCMDCTFQTSAHLPLSAQF